MRILILSLCIPGLVVPHAAAAQEPSPDSVAYRPFLSAGLSQFLGDLGEENNSAAGPTGRVGLRFPGSTAALSFSYWPDVNRFRLASLHLDLGQELASWGRFTPDLVVGVGHTWAKHLDEGPTSNLGGASAAFGFGVHTTLTDRVGIDTDLRLRTDGGGWNGEWRLLAELRTADVLRSATGGRTTVFGSWMSAVDGPWVTVEPAWGLRVARDDGVLTVKLVHWQIPDEGFLGGYLWDTRGVIAAAQTERGLFGDRILFRIGPAISAMGEGPDDGVNFGGQTDLVLEFDIVDIRVESSVGYMWLDRGSEASDQGGVIFSVGVGG